MVRTISTPETGQQNAGSASDALTLKAAADLLKVDRRYLVTLLDADEIPATGTGAHRHIRRDDLLSYKAKRDAARRAAMRALTRISEESGQFDADYRPLLDNPV
ncbi:MAG: helix-turn-helix domain-containing protein [Thermomicrobiales bacterium]